MIDPLTYWAWNQGWVEKLEGKSIAAMAGEGPKHTEGSSPLPTQTILTQSLNTNDISVYKTVISTTINNIDGRISKEGNLWTLKSGYMNPNTSVFLYCLVCPLF